jgi:hypothetical protein
MKLNLRTLLAYLDDTLEPAQAKIIAGKIQESEAAQQLVERIKQVLRKRRLAAPAEQRPSKIDPNTVAEYLDQAADAEAAAEIEQIVLLSDVHLAEVAQCHQMLSLHLADAKDYPESARQRMYELVTGPEARKAVKGDIGFPTVPAKASALKPADKPSGERRAAASAPARRAGNNWYVFGGALAAVLLLGFALWRLLDFPAPNSGPVDQPVAQNEKDKSPENGASNDKDSGDKDKADTPDVPILPPVKIEEKPKPMVETPLPMLPETKGKEPEIKLPPLVLPTPPKSVEVVKVPFAAPNNKIAPVAKMMPPGPEPVVLLQKSNEPPLAWVRLGLRLFDIYSGRSYVNLPGVTTVFNTPSHLAVLLVGNLAQINPYLGDFETRVDVHFPDAFDFDLTLHRGRLVLISGAEDKPLTVRIRFDNPTFPGQNDHWDITLHEKGAEVMIDRMCQMPVGEPFYRNASNPERRGPIAVMKCMVRKGTATVQINDVKRTLTASFGRVVDLSWNSLKGSIEGPTPYDVLPEWAKDAPAQPKGFDDKQRSRGLQARDHLLKLLRESEVDVALTNAGKTNDADIRVLAVRYSEAIDDIPAVLDSLKSEQRPLRVAAILALRDWITLARDNDYKLFDLLQKNNKTSDSEIIMQLLHYFSEPQLQLPETWELLINYLIHPNLAVRELSAWHLYVLNRNAKIEFDANNPQVCQRAHAAWMNLLHTKQLPPPRK